MIKKTVIVNRAVPGSGKTTITNCIVDELKKNNINVTVHSTDEYFMVEGKYIFNIDDLGKHHESNMEEFERSIDMNTEVVICDNTNIAPWQTEPYTELARENGYKVLMITLNPRELSKHIESQKVTEEKPDAHGVTENILKKMIVEYDLYDDLLNQNIVIDESKYFHYTWDDRNNKEVIVGLAKHFDSDAIIRILPHEYKEYQPRIGKKVLEFIKN